MKNFNLLKLSFAAALLSAAPLSMVQAQPHIPAFAGNFYADFIGERVMITAPTSVARSLNYTISDDGSQPANDWGAPITVPINSQLVKADPYRACATLTNATAINGKIALIERGDCEFGAKAKAAQDAGAIAVVIVNNVDGGPVGMGAGAVGMQVTIPVLMISKDDGAAIATALGSGAVSITISKWGNNATHDLGIVKSGVSMWHNYAIPGSQMVNASNHLPYKGQDAIVVANFGGSTETNVKLATKVTFYPDGGGAPQLIKQDTVLGVTSFTTGDSIRTIINKNPYNLLSSKQEGRYEIRYEVFADATDGFPSDNVYTHNFYVNRTVFSKSRYDFANNRPMSNIGFRYGSTQVTNFVMGPLYYVATGGHQIKEVQAAVSLDAASNDDLDGILGNLQCLVWKWVDGSGSQPKDSVIQMGEASLVGEATYQFDGDDTGGQFFTIPVKDIVDQTKPLIAEAGTWYWVTAAMPNTAFVAMDGQLNYMVRTFARHNSNQPYNEYYSPATPNSYDQLQTTATNAPGMYPFEGTNFIDSARFSQQRKGTIPSIPMIISQFPVSVNDKIAGVSDLKVSVFPNPAKETITISANLKNTNDIITIRVVDGLGRLVKFETKKYDGTKEFTVSVNDLAVGNYHVLFSVGADTRVVQFTKAK